MPSTQQLDYLGEIHDVPTEGEIRREVRRFSKESLYYLAGVTLQMADLIPELHQPAADFIQLTPWNGGPPNSLHKLLWMPRGHFKSSLTSVGLPIFYLISDRNATIGLVSSREKNTQRWMKDIRNTIDFNPFFQWAFPEIAKGDKWDATEITIDRDSKYGTNVASSVAAFTIKGGLASAHCKHVILDDPLNEKSAFSESERERAIGLYVHLESITSKYEESTFMLVGTPWPGYDVIQHAMEHEVAHGERLFWGIGARGGFSMSPELYESHPHFVPQVEQRLARDKVIFSEFCPDKKLNKIKRQDLTQYQYQYLCTRPDDEDNGFNISLIRDFALLSDGAIQCSCHGEHEHHLTKLITVAICDPALTEDRKGCESAFVVLGRDPNCGCRFILEEQGEHIPPDQLVVAMTAQANRWAAYLQRYAIEDVKFQTIFKSWMLELQSEGKFPLDVELYGVSPKRRDKDLRISGQQSYVANGLWHKRPTMMFEESKVNLIWQIAKWPNQPKKRDRVDAWAYAEDAWSDLGVGRLASTLSRPNLLRAENQRIMKRTLLRMAGNR